MSTKIKDLQLGEVTGKQFLVLISEVAVLNFKKKEGKFYNLTLIDSTGSIKGVLWDTSNYLELPTQIADNDGVYAYITGTVSYHEEEKQINIRSIEIEEDSNVNLTDFLPTVSKSRTELYGQIQWLVNEVKDKELKNLLNAFFKDEKWRNGYQTSVAAVKHHHNYIGGLMEHSLEVTVGALQFATNKVLYPELNKDLLIAGGILHDVGKIEEYVYSRRIAMNPFGLEHRYTGCGIVDKVLYQNNLTMDTQKLRDLKHIIISHHGSFGDVQPDIPEAIVIHHADCASAHLNGYYKKKERK